MICAAPTVNNWYRTQVISTDEENDKSVVKLVDFGGFMDISNSLLKQIRQDFFTMIPFQATEIQLANIIPINGGIVIIFNVFFLSWYVKLMLSFFNRGMVAWCGSSNSRFNCESNLTSASRRLQRRVCAAGVSISHPRPAGLYHTNCIQSLDLSVCLFMFYFYYCSK